MERRQHATSSFSQSKLIRDLKVMFWCGHVGWLLIWITNCFDLWSFTKGIGAANLSRANQITGGMIVGIWVFLDHYLEQFLGNPLSDIVTFPLTYGILIFTGTIFLGIAALAVVTWTVLWIVSKLFGVNLLDDFSGGK